MMAGFTASIWIETENSSTTQAQKKPEIIRLFS